MKHFFDPSVSAELRHRLATMRPESERQWGTMNPAQALAHCSAAMRMVTGELRPPRAFIGYLVGGFVKRMVTSDDRPLRRSTPTARELVITEPRDFETERAGLLAQVNALASKGPGACTSYPHAFFGRMTPDEWSVLVYKHLDHHLRQFGA